MIDTEIAVALIASGGGVLGAFAGVIASAKLMTYRMGQLEKKVDKHNKFAERMPVVERDIQVVMQEQIRVANHRIQDLEEGRA